LNFNDFYSHNKIQEHFITQGKICNGVNAINNYLFKYITLYNFILFQKSGRYTLLFRRDAVSPPWIRGSAAVKSIKSYIRLTGDTMLVTLDTMSEILLFLLATAKLD
jgi:hypothetical protein